MEEFALKALQILLQSVISGVIVGLVAWGAMKANMANIKSRQEEMARSLDGIAAQVNTNRTARSDCELRAARTYAGKEDLNHVFDKLEGIGDRMGERIEDLRREMHQDLQGVHGRVTEVAKSVARFQGEGE